MSSSHQQQHNTYETVRSMTPSGRVAPAATTPSSTGLIRLRLKKPMGIVFEPTYDPNNSSEQRGVRICDLPRTGAAALSRKLQVGDELLQINDTTVSRMTFDEIMDFIIEADPDAVSLLFRRPRKETLQKRQGVQQKLHAAANKDTPSTVKWVDEEERPSSKKKKAKKKRDKKHPSPKRTKQPLEDEDATLQSKSTVGTDSYVKSSKRRSKKARSRKNSPYEAESFLDMLIDSICADGACRDTARREGDDYSDEESEEDTYATYEESLKQHRKPEKEKLTKKYEDDGTLETVETRDREEKIPPPVVPVVPPLGLAPNPPPMHHHPAPGEETDEETKPAPIKEVEYDDRIDHGADVSVMDSLGGPSLLIDKQRMALMAAANQPVSADIIDNYGLDYPNAHGMTRTETIYADPPRFYSHVVKQLLQDNEPEKVRLLDKLLDKYKGREDHLVQKLVMRYKQDSGEPNYTENVTTKPKQSTRSMTTPVSVKEQHNMVVEHHHQRNEEVEEEQPPPIRQEEQIREWPDKETKEPEEEDEQSESESEYSRDSVDGTSPAVIAQVSELLNYVYGKTSVPGQIDRVSTIMRAYEGREAVLLELLETKALIKANKEKENADNLPSFLRNSNLSSPQNDGPDSPSLPPVTPMASNPTQGGTVIGDDISSMSGVSSPAVELSDKQGYDAETPKKRDSPMKEGSRLNAPSSVSSRNSLPPSTTDRRKKKGLFGGLFGKKKPDQRTSSRSNGRARLMGNRSVEGSI